MGRLFPDVTRCRWSSLDNITQLLLRLSGDFIRYSFKRFDSVGFCYGERFSVNTGGSFGFLLGFLTKWVDYKIKMKKI